MEKLARELDRDLDRLEVRGCPLKVVNYLRSMKEAVLDVFRGRAKVYRPRPGMKLALPVISFSVLDARRQMEMVRTTMTTGIVRLTNPGRITNESHVPEAPHWCLFVEDGRQYVNLSLLEAIKLIKDDDRVPLIAECGVALAIHTELQHGIDLPDSRYRKEINEKTGEVIKPELVPVILPGDRAHEPELMYTELDRSAFRLRGVPSRARDIVE